MGSKMAWLAFGALALGIAYAIRRGHRQATLRRATRYGLDCVQCASGDVVSCFHVA